MGRANLGRLVRADQGQSGAIVAHGHIAGEGSGGVQNGRAECLGTAGPGILKKLVDTSQAEFVFMVGLFVVALAADDSARNKQNSGTFFEADGGSVGGGVGEESQRQAGRAQFSDPATIAEKSGSVAGIGVAECAELFVVAGDESRAGTDAAGDFKEAAIEAQTEFRHGLGFVDVRAGEKLGSAGAKDFLRYG